MCKRLWSINKYVNKIVVVKYLRISYRKNKAFDSGWRAIVDLNWICKSDTLIILGESVCEVFWVFLQQHHIQLSQIADVRFNFQLIPQHIYKIIMNIDGWAQKTDGQQSHVITVNNIDWHTCCGLMIKQSSEFVKVRNF